MTLNDNFKQAVEFATDELHGFYDRGNSFSALNQKSRSEILEVFSDDFDWLFHLNKAADDFHSFDSLKRYCAHLTRTEKKMPDELKHWLADFLEGIQPTLTPPRGRVTTGLENNMLLPRLVERSPCFSSWTEHEMTLKIEGVPAMRCSKQSSKFKGDPKNAREINA